MNDLRFTQIVDAYGSRPERWPVAERAAMQQYISTHAKAQQHINNQARLDAQLDADLITDLVAPILQHQIALEARIMANLPPVLPLQARQEESLADRLLTWLLPPPNRPVFWRPALIACIPLLAGLVIGSNVSLETLDDSYTWEDQVYLLGLSTDTESVEGLQMEIMETL